MPMNATAAERIQAAIQVDADAGCWVWQRSKNPDGYGRIRFQGRVRLAHRFAYETFVGPIPEGMELDHVRDRGCRFRHCVNPDHLEPVTSAENTRRGMAPNHLTHRTGVCRRGHAITGDNAARASDGRTRCRECLNASGRQRARRYRAKLARAGS